VDFDPQGSLSYIMGGNPKKPAIQTTDAGDILPASRDLSTITDEHLLERILKPLKARYDVIVIDSPPTFGTAQNAALRAADEVLIPLQPDGLCLQGLYHVREQIDEVNPDIKILGAFFAKYRGRTALARDVGQAIRDRCAIMGIPFLDIAIREGIALQEAQFMHEPIFTYAPKSNPAKDYSALLDAIKI
jgi:chromosome partitioning protein